MSNEDEKEELVWPNIFFEDEIIQPPDLPDQFTKPPKKTIPELLSEIALEYPKVATRLMLCLGTPEFEMEMNKLLIDDRHGRQGFPPDIMKLLLLLSSTHTEQFGHLLNPSDIWIHTQGK